MMPMLRIFGRSSIQGSGVRGQEPGSFIHCTTGPGRRGARGTEAGPTFFDGRSRNVDLPERTDVSSRAGLFRLAPSFLPCTKQATDDDELSQVVGVVIRDEQRL